MNQSVASYAPKTKTYSTTTSLLCRVHIAAAVQILGHAPLWKRIFSRLGLQIDDNLLNILLGKDEVKMRKKVRSQTIEGKTVRSTTKYESLAQGHKAQMNDLMKGDAYESGITVSAARKNLKAAPKRNKEPKETWTCIYYHPDYWTVKAHKDCMSPLCMMKLRSKEEREAALKVIENEKIEQEVMKLSMGKLLYYCMYDWILDISYSYKIY